MVASSVLAQTYNAHPLGLCGQNEPARIVGVVEDVERRLTTLTLGVVLDINPLTQERWAELLALAGLWLCDPSHVAYQSSQQVLAAMQDFHLRFPQHIPRVWWQICRGVQGRFKGSWKDLLEESHCHASAVQDYLRKSKTTFPVLAGPVISARWLDLIHRIGGIPLDGWENLSVPLPRQQEKTARLFGIEKDVVHPLLFSALWAWPDACKRFPDGSCGLRECPRKNR